MLTEIADENLTYRVAAMMVAKEEVQSDPPDQEFARCCKRTRYRWPRFGRS